MHDLTKVDYAYLAGFVDGDGYIWIGFDSEGYSSQRMGLTQKDRGYLEMWKDRIGSGHIQLVASSYGTSYSLVWGSAVTRTLCRGTAPYLRLKREKALIAARGHIAEDRSEELLWPYLAGLIDAEGTIGIYKSSAGKKREMYATPRLQIPQSDEGLLRGLCSELGFGSVGKRGKSGIGTQMWYLRFGSNDVRKVLNKVRPYLIAKADKADKVLAHEKKIRVDSATHRPDAQRAKELYESGMSVADVARMLDKKPATVNYWLRQMGLTRSYKQAQRLRRDKEKRP